MLRLGAFLALLIAALVGATVAGAGTVSVSDQTLVYEADPGEANHLTITVAPEEAQEGDTVTWTVTETGAPLTLGPGCMVVDAQTASCLRGVVGPWPSSFGLVLDIGLADGNDWVSAVDGCLWDDRFQIGCSQQIEGGPGNDTLFGADKAHFEGDLEGGEGDDVILGGEAGAFLLGGPGSDLLRSSVPSVLDGGPGADTLDAEGTFDTVLYSDRFRRVLVSLNGRRDDGEKGENDLVTGAEKIVTGSGADVIIGNSRENLIQAGAGNDVVYAGGGNDRVYGDSVACGAFDSGGPGGADRIHGQSGRDSLFGCGGNDAIYGGAGSDFIAGKDGADRLLGLARADRIVGGRGRDTIVGGRGADDLRGQEGNDIFYARDGRADKVLGWTGRDRARTDRGLDRLSSIERLF